MSKGWTTSWIVLFAFGVWSCSSDDPFDPNKYTRSYIISTGLPVNGPGTIATYYPEDGTLINESYRLPVASGVQDGISDLTIAGSELYLVRSATRVIEILDAKTYASKGSINYGQGLSFNKPINKRKLIDVAAGKIFVADIGTTAAGFASYLKAINASNVSQQDSIPLGENLDFLSLAHSTDSVLVSVEGQVKLINAQSLAVQDLFTLANPVMNVSLYRGAVYSFAEGNVAKNVSTNWAAPEFDVHIHCYEVFPGAMSGRKHVFAGDGMYFVQEPSHGMPGSEVFVARMSLNVDILGAWEIESSGTIAYDEETQTLLAGTASDDTAKGTAMVTGYDGFGTVKFKIYLPGTVTKILVTP